VDQSSDRVALLLMGIVLAALAIRLLSTAVRPHWEVLKWALAGLGALVLVSMILLMLIASLAMNA
jgi:hypothetical protein